MVVVIMRYAEQYPKLRYLFAAYFHQHWVDSGSFENIVHEFLEENPAATVSQARRELEAFLNIDLPEDELHDVVVHDLGANVRAAGTGLTYRQWLEAVLAILKKPTRGSGDTHGGRSSHRR
jgi:CdiI immunity protein